MKINGAQIILRKLRKNQVKLVFQFPGGSICPILDELHRQKAMKIITFRHEQAAVHAADAYARVTKKPSVCMATSGPGASNLVTGIANAFMDSVPLVIITGQVAVWDMKKKRPVRQRGFQELDIVSVVKSITKAAFLVNHVSDLGKTLDKAFFIARSGRPGPVLVDVPINVQYTDCDYRDQPIDPCEKKPVVSGSDIKEIAERLQNAQRPLILAGGGVILSASQGILVKLLQKYNFPVAETLMGLAAVPTEYAYNLGLVGYAGSQPTHLAVKEADFILGLGLRFDNRAFPAAGKDFNHKAYLVHVDCDKHELNHRVIVDKAVFSDLKLFLEGFSRRLNKAAYRSPASWLAKIKTYKSQAPEKNSGLKPDFILSRLSELLKNKQTIITTDVGQHQLWTAQYFRFDKAKTLLTSGGLGTMGFGLPAAIGAKFACPNAQVIQITSDGSLQMNIQELATVKDYGLPIKIVLFNNKCLGLVRQIQEFTFCRRYASTCLNANVDFVKIASAYGIQAFTVSNPSGVEPALRKIINSRKAILADFRIPESENVYPIRVKGKIIYTHEQA